MLRDVAVGPQQPRDEAEARLHLAACYRLVAHFGMDDLIYTHASCRIPGEPDAFLINPYGLLFREITPSNLVKVGWDGRPRPAAQRLKIDNANWPDTIEAQSDTYLGEAYLGPWN